MDSKGKIEYFSEHHIISISESRCKTSLAVVIGRVTLVVVFDFLPQKFGKLAGTCEWYFVIL